MVGTATRHAFLGSEGANFDLGSLSSGESVSVMWAITIAQPLPVAYPPVGSSGDNGPFRIGGEGPLSCLITAT
jgi:hypothetical protein